jgi:hypothetical protein
MKALTPNEVAVIQMSLDSMIQDMETVSKNQKIPFTPESRKDIRDILNYAKSALAKIAIASGKLIKLDPYHEGDEKEFLTKES